jgi:transposase
VVEYERGKAKKNRPGDCTTDVGLRFSDEVPVEVINITLPESAGSDVDQYKIIDTKISRKLVKLPASYIVLEYHLPAIKKIGSGDVRTTRMPDQVMDISIADMSLLVGLLINKFLYHNPLHRQH